MTKVFLLFLSVFILSAGPVEGQEVFFPPLTIQEEDGSPSVTGFDTIKIPNTSLVDNGDGTVSLSYISSESDPIATAINGILKSDGTTLSALTAFADLQTIISDAVLLKAGTLTDTKYCIYDSASGTIICNSAGGAGGSAITFDIGDDGGNDSVDVTEIATTGDTNSIFTEPTADKILIAVGNNWPTADTVVTNANLTGVVTSVGNATAIANKALAIAKLADGTDGQLITWDASGVIAAIATGTATHVLTSNGVGTAPTFQAAAGGGATALDDIGDPDAATTITMGDNEAITLTSAEDTGTVLTINMTDNDMAGNTFGLDIIHAGDANSVYQFMRCYDNTNDLQFSITSNGNVTGGTLTSRSWMLNEGGNYISQRLSDTAAIVPEVTLRKARDGTPTSDVSDDDYLGQVTFEGYHTDGYDTGATIRAIVDGTPGNTDMPARLEFLVSPDASATPVLALTINNAGNFDFQDGNLTTTGTFEAATLTQGGQAMYDANDVPGGELGGTFASFTIDDLFIKLGGDIATAGTYNFGEASVIVELPNSIADTALGNAGEMNLNATDDQVSFHFGATGQISGEAAISGLRHLTATFNPDAICDLTTARVFLMTVGPDAPEGIKIVKWSLSFDVDPTTEFGADETLLKYADAFIGVANTATIDDLATTAGVSSEDTDANINGGAAVATTKVIYLDFPTAYTEALHSVIFEMWFFNEED